MSSVDTFPRCPHPMTANVTNWLEPGLVWSVSIVDGDFNLIDRRQRFLVLFMRPAMDCFCAGQPVRINITSSLRVGLGGKASTARNNGPIWKCSCLSVCPAVIAEYASHSAPPHRKDQVAGQPRKMDAISSAQGKKEGQITAQTRSTAPFVQTLLIPAFHPARIWESCGQREGLGAAQDTSPHIISPRLCRCVSS